MQREIHLTSKTNSSKQRRGHKNKEQIGEESVATETPLHNNKTKKEEKNTKAEAEDDEKDEKTAERPAFVAEREAGVRAAGQFLAAHAPARRDRVLAGLALRHGRRAELHQAAGTPVADAWLELARLAQPGVALVLAEVVAALEDAVADLAAAVGADHLLLNLSFLHLHLLGPSLGHLGLALTRGGRGGQRRIRRRRRGR